MRFLLLITLLLVCFNVSSASKEYQKTLINEPVSLLDLTMFNANLKAAEYKESLNYKKSIYTKVIRDLRDFDFDKRLLTLDFYLPINFPDALHARFDFGSGLFYFEQELSWDLNGPIKGEPKENLELNKVIKGTGLKVPIKYSIPPELLTNQKNVTLICNMLLRGMAFLTIIPEDHAGYSTKASRELPEDIIAEAIADTVYRVTISLENFYEDYPSMECETTGKERFKDDGNVTYKYSGSWYQLDKIINKVRAKNL
tara:strand:- start:615 stop:1382 length:768 start_codon:yes stop_codon:yes gene_type:complete